MKKLDQIRQLCVDTIVEYKAAKAEFGEKSGVIAPERFRAELAEEVLEILNGELK